MKRINLLLLVTFVLLTAACLGEGVKNAEMAVGTKVAEAIGSLESTEITAAQFMDMYIRGEDFVLIDVRTREEYDSGYIPGAINIHYTEIEEGIRELNIPNEAKIVVICEAGVRSKKAAYALNQAGYTNIIDVTDGMMGWRNLGGDLIVPEMETAKPLSDNGSIGLGVLITPDELSEYIDNYKVIFLGTKNQYETGHIPGAVHIDPLTGLLDPEGAVPHMVLKKADFESLMSGLGITPEDTVIVYDDQKDRKYAARFFWILKYYSHENVAILDGGLSSWKGYGGKLSTARPEIQSADYSVKEVHDELLATLDYVNENLNNPGVVLVDATTKEEHENEGHIPGAVLVEPEETLNPDGTIKDEGELLSIYTSKGVTRDKEVITYCHTGHRAAVIWFELKHLLNYPKVRLYDGSLEEWNAFGMPFELSGPSATESPQPKDPQIPGSPPTAQPERIIELSVEPSTIIPLLEGAETFDLKIMDAVKVEDVIIYLTGGFLDACAGIYSFEFNVYLETGEGHLYEGTALFVTETYPGLFSDQDISEKVHENSDALDNYRVIVEEWKSGEGVVLTISH